MRALFPLAAAIFAVTLGPPAPASAQTGDPACHAAPTSECVLALAHEAERAIEQPMERVRALAGIAIAESMAGYPQHAEASFALARQIAEEPGLSGSAETGMMRLPDDVVIDMQMPRRDEAVRSSLYSEIVAAQVRAGMPADRVARFIEDIDPPQLRPMLGMSAATAYAEADRKDDARIFLKAVTDGLEGLDDRNAGPAGFGMGMPTVILMLQVRIGDSEDAIATLIDPSTDIEPTIRISMLSEIARQKERDGEREGALAIVTMAGEYIAKIENSELRDMMSDMNAREKAELTGEKQDHAGNDGTTESGGGCAADLSPAGFAMAQAELGYFDSAVESALDITEQEKRESSLSRIAQIRAEKGDADGAHRTAIMITEPFMRSFAFQSIAEAQAEAGNTDGVRAAAREIQEEYLRDQTLVQSIESLVIADNAAGAASIARDMHRPANRAAAYASIAQSMAINIAADKETAVSDEAEVEATKEQEAN